MKPNKCHSPKPVTVRIIVNKTVCPNKNANKYRWPAIPGFKMIGECIKIARIFLYTEHKRKGKSIRCEERGKCRVQPFFFGDKKIIKVVKFIRIIK